MKVVEHPERIETGDAALAALLPVHPPEVDAVLFIGMVKDLEIAFHKMRVGNVEWDGLFCRRLDVHPFRHGFVLLFVWMNPASRVQVQCRAQSLIVQPLNEPIRIREEFAVPGVAGPAIGGVSGFGDVPVHVDDADGEWNLFGAEILHQGFQFLLGVGPVAAPPVAKDVAWDHRNGSTDAGEITQAGSNVRAVSEEV